MKRTPEEISDEIAAVKKLKPVGRWASKTTATIRRVVDELEGNSFDTTTEEFNELPTEQQDAIMRTLDWLDGDNDERPSEGWAPLVEE